MFQYCGNLRSIEIPNGVTTLLNQSFKSTGVTSVYLPDSVTELRSAFQSCQNLETIRLSENLSQIGEFAFDYCSALKNIEIPTSVTLFKNRSFRGCSALESIYIPASVTSMGPSVFEDCSALTIKAAAYSKPTGWNDDWNPSNRPVIWGYQAA
jgi:hypothetical protein